MSVQREALSLRQQSGQNDSRCNTPPPLIFPKEWNSWRSSVLAPNIPFSCLMASYMLEVICHLSPLLHFMSISTCTLEGKPTRVALKIFASYLKGSPDIIQSETHAVTTAWLCHFESNLRDFSHSKNLVQFNLQVVINTLDHMTK